MSTPFTGLPNRNYTWLVLPAVPVTLVITNSPVNAGDTGLVPGEDPLEKEMAIHSSILAWEIPQREESDVL